MFKAQYNDSGYFIVIENLHNNTDKIIANEIKISIRKYRGILKKFNATPKRRNEHYFYNLDDAEKCCEYLNENYSLLLKMTRGY